jgi:hypothetical protein
MGACISSPDEATERERSLHREAEKLLKEVCSRPLSMVSHSLSPLFQARTRMASQVKVNSSISLQPLTISLIVLTRSYS